MNIPYTFKIYWFENEDDWLESTKERLIEQFEDSNIELEIIPYKTLQDVDKIDSETEIDLMLMDYHLGDVKGNDLIIALRDKNVLCNIIFYSQDPDFATSLQEAEGVFTTARANIGSELTKSVNDCDIITGNVSNMRGKFITGAVDLEEKMNEVLCNFLESAKGDFLKEHIVQTEFFNTMAKKKVISKIADFLLENLKNNLEKLKILEESEGLKILEELEEKETLNREIAKLNKTKSVFKKYDDEIIHVRNTLAHSKHYVSDNNETIFINKAKNETYIIDEKWIRDKLAHLTKHSINLDRLKGFI